MSLSTVTVSPSQPKHVTQKMARYPGYSRAESAETPVIQCSALPRACLTVLQQQPTCSRDCSNRSFRIDVYGNGSAASVQRALKDQRGLRDPLSSFTLRHLERDVFAHERYEQPSPGSSLDTSIHMFWPRWERGFGDFIMSTLAPMGYASAFNRALGEMGMLWTFHSRFTPPRS